VATTIYYLGTARARQMYYSLIDEKGIDRFCEDPQ